MKLFNPYSKYGAIRTRVDGITFASKGEAALYQHLKLCYHDVECQPKVYLSKAKILFKPDFKTNILYWEFKGAETPVWRLKRKLWKAYGPSRLLVYKMKNGKLFLADTIIPDGVVCE